MQVRSLGWEDALEEGMATHSSILAWRIPWTEEPGRLQFMGQQRDTTEETQQAHTQQQVFWKESDKVKTRSLNIYVKAAAFRYLETLETMDFAERRKRKPEEMEEILIGVMAMVGRKGKSCI